MKDLIHARTSMLGLICNRVILARSYQGDETYHPCKLVSRRRDTSYPSKNETSIILTCVYQEDEASVILAWVYRERGKNLARGH